MNLRREVCYSDFVYFNSEQSILQEESKKAAELKQAAVERKKAAQFVERKNAILEELKQAEILKRQSAQLENQKLTEQVEEKPKTEHAQVNQQQPALL